MKRKYRVVTRDVDGGDVRTYSRLEAAVKRFEAMSGWKVEKAMSEQFYNRDPASLPKIEDFAGALRAVSDYGCVVTLVCPGY